MKMWTAPKARVGTRARGAIAHLEAVVLDLVVDVRLDTVRVGADDLSGLVKGRGARQGLRPEVATRVRVGKGG